MPVVPDTGREPAGEALRLTCPAEGRAARSASRPRALRITPTPLLTALFLLLLWQPGAVCADQLRVVGETVEVKAKADPKAPILTIAEPGATFPILLEQSGPWYMVEIGDGRYGWIAASPGVRRVPDPAPTTAPAEERGPEAEGAGVPAPTASAPTAQAPSRGAAPKGPTAWEAIQRELGKARKLHDAKRYRDALTHIERAQGLAPQNMAIRAFMALTYFRIGEEAFQANDLKEAKRFLERAIATDAGQPPYYLLLARVHSSAGEAEEGVRVVEEAYRRWPRDPVIGEWLEHLRAEAAVEEGFESRATAHFVIRYEGDRPYARSIGERVLAAAERAYTQVGLDLLFFPQSRVDVVLYSSGQQFSQVTQAEYAQALYDGRIRVPLISRPDGSLALPPGYRQTIIHEYTHHLVRLLTHERAPRWLNEGIAQYEELSPEERRARVRLLASQPEIVPVGRLFSEPMRSLKELELHYMESLSLVTYTVERYGIARIRDLLKECARSEGAEELTPQRLIEGALHVPWHSFRDGWLSYLMRG